MSDNKQLQLKEKHEADIPAEQTYTGLVFSPDVDIFESETEITLLSDMPGVDMEDMNIDLRDDVLTIEGNVQNILNEGETYVLNEFKTGRYFRRFSLSDKIDQSEITAKLENGVLRLTLPKSKKAVPRKIAIETV